MENLEPEDYDLKKTLLKLSANTFEIFKFQALEHYAQEKANGKCDTCIAYPCDIIHLAEGKFDHLKSK